MIARGSSDPCPGPVAAMTGTGASGGAETGVTSGIVGCPGMGTSDGVGIPAFATGVGGCSGLHMIIVGAECVAAGAAATRACRTGVRRRLTGTSALGAGLGVRRGAWATDGVAAGAWVRRTARRRGRGLAGAGVTRAVFALVGAHSMSVSPLVGWAADSTVA